LSRIAQVLGGQAFQVLTQVNDADAVDLLSLELAAADAVVDGDDVGPGRIFSWATASKRPGSCVPASGGRRVDVHDLQAFFVLQLLDRRRPGGDEQLLGGRARTCPNRDRFP